jgi:alkanesulfonate monooxygenase SsuD/methylene tetrahydromethanopterin reductase-like flavin-dependent oxidoreductase (luciferase family)
MLDALSDGRLRLGFGRGLARDEYQGFSVSMEESRDRFNEAANMILDGLDNGYIDHDGKYFKQARRDIFPTPARGFRDRLFNIAMSPPSTLAAAEFGGTLMCFNYQCDIEKQAAQFNMWRDRFLEVHGSEPPAPVLLDFTYCHEDADTADKTMRDHLAPYYNSMVDHYEFDGKHFGKTKGYEHYSTGADMLLDVGREAGFENFLGLQWTGTPEKIIEQMRQRTELIGPFRQMLLCSYGGMPLETVQDEPATHLRAGDSRSEQVRQNGNRRGGLRRMSSRRAVRVRDNSSPYWNPERELRDPVERDAATLVQLRRQLHRAYQLPFYRRHWDEHGFAPEQVTSFDDFTKRCPIITKKMLVQDQAEHPPFGSYLGIPREEIFRIHGSSGTSGTPTMYGVARKDWDHGREIFAMTHWASGVRPTDIVHFAFPFGMFFGGWAMLYAAESVGAAVLPMGARRDPPTSGDDLQDGLHGHRGDTSYMLHMAEVARKSGYDTAASPLRVFLSGVNPVDPSRRPASCCWRPGGWRRCVTPGPPRRCFRS